MTTEPLAVYQCDQCDLRGVGAPPRCARCSPGGARHASGLSWWRRSWRYATVFAAGLALGWVAGVVEWSGRQSAKALSPEALNTAFMTLISQEIGIRDSRVILANWVMAADSTLYFEVAAPGGDPRTSPWESLNQEERQGFMEFMALAYDRFLMENGESPVDEQGAFRPIGLKYLGLNVPLAVRQRNGEVVAFPSIYARPSTGP